MKIHWVPKENIRTNWYDVAIILGLAVAGLVGFYFAVPYSGLVLGVGLLKIVATIY